MNFVLEDPSTEEIPELAEGVDLIMFGAQAALPQVKACTGDIIRLHRVNVSTWKQCRPSLCGAGHM
jgi:hypothetical protein